jgi:microcystin-dependent protein
MSEPFLGEIRMVGWNFAANGWAFCNGQLMRINHTRLYFHYLIDACRIGCDATPDVCADAVSGPAK